MRESVSSPALLIGEDMLHIVTDIHGIQYGQIMDLYAQDLLDAANKSYGDLPVNEGLFNAEQDFYAFLRDVFFQTPGAFFALWLEDGIYCAGLRMEPWQDGMLLCGIITREDRRRKGYAHRLVKQILEQVESRPVYSHVEKGNLASIALHEKCGFTLAGESAQMLDGSLLHNFCTFTYGK